VKLDNQSVKENVIRRLRRIEGQVRGIQKMVEEERDCNEIMQQLSAIRSAVHGTSLLFMRVYISKCLVQSEDPQKIDRQDMIDDLINLLDKYQ
jgi:CsoR family transcriptional regulator, copper-sensing transcriptional repressor